MTNTIQLSVVAFVVLSVIIAAFCGESMQKSSKKHIIAACFIALAAFIHAIVIVMNLR